MNSMMAEFVAILGWALINFLWQGLAIGMAAALLLTVLRNARPQARYAVACIALACCLVLPIASIVHALQSDTNVPVVTHATLVQSTTVSSSVSVTPVPMWHSMVQGQIQWIVVAWSLGAGLLALRMALGLAWVGRLKASAGVVDAQWQARLDRLACALDIRHPVWLRIGEGIDGPIAAGWWRPVVLVPAALIARMPTELLEALLAHELAHIRRRDYLINLMQCAVEALLFYHPVTWWLSRQIRIEREQIADDLALTAVGEPRRLALALQHLDLFQREETRLADAYFVPAANGGNLMMRIQRLLRPTRHVLTWNMALPILGLAAVCLAVNARENAVSTIATTPQTRATPALVAPIKTRGTLRLGAHGKSHESYAMVREGSDELMLSGDIDDISAIKRAQQHVHGDFLWFRRGATAYVVQDSTLLAKATAAWQPTEAVGDKLEALDKQMRPHASKMEALGKQMEAASQRGEPYSAQMEQIGKRMEPLARQQEALGRKMEQLGKQMASSDSDARRDQLGREMEALQSKMEVLSEQMEKLSEVMERHSGELEKAHQPMEALGKQMEAAGKPMEALGDKMEVLGEQMDALSKEADRKVKLLIDEAMRNGKAVRADSISRL
jgi:beta-lactamase regulating signal transducer with metallopeptidase domain/predicted  nucleic acid-binding Zn-ribbon protein